ncbi:MAG: hypothetical protein ACYTGX_02135 [Planctomycetota bacterium]
MFASPAAAQEDAPASANKSEEARVAALLQRARAAKEKRDFETAARLYAEALVLKPKSSEAREGQAETKNDDYWYHRKPIRFEVPTGGQWQSAQALDVGQIQRAPDFRRQLGGPLNPGAGGGVGGFKSYTGARGPGGVGQVQAQIGGPVGPIQGSTGSSGGSFGPGPISPVVGGNQGGGGNFTGGPARYEASRDNSAFSLGGRSGSSPSWGGGGGYGGAQRGIAAAVLGVLLYGIYDYAIPVDLSIDPMPYLRGGGFSPLFGFSRMEAALPVSEDVWKVSLVYGNWFTSADDEGADATIVPASGSPDVTYRFDNNRFDEGMLRVDYGIGYGLSSYLGITVTNMQETSEKIIFNRNGYVHVADQSRSANAGNVLLGIKWGMPVGGSADRISGVGAGLDLKVPVGDPADFATSGTFDIALVGRWTQMLYESRNPWIMHLNVGVMMPIGEDGFFEHPPVAASSPAPPADDEVEARPALFWGLGFAWKATQHIALTTSFEGNASPFDGQGDAGGLGDGSFGIADGMSFTANLGIRVLFDKLEFEASIANDLGVGDIRALTGRIGITLYFGGAPAPTMGAGGGGFGGGFGSGLR